MPSLQGKVLQIDRLKEELSRINERLECLNKTRQAYEDTVRLSFLSSQQTLRVLPLGLLQFDAEMRSKYKEEADGLEAEEQKRLGRIAQLFLEMHKILCRNDGSP
jgi:hypothetical protein